MLFVYLLFICAAIISLTPSKATASVIGDPADSECCVSDVLHRFVESNALSGAVVLVANHQDVLAVECAGYSNLEIKRLMQPDDLFWIASMTKAMTVCCVLMLAEEGKLSIDDPVCKYIPEFNDQMVLVEADENHNLLRKPKNPVTIKQLLNHTSGVLGSYPYSSVLDVPSLEERVLGAALTPLAFEPGSCFSYGNGGYETAGRIIELVSGVGYWEFIKTRLLQPLGMGDTDFAVAEADMERLAESYLVDDTDALVSTSCLLSYPLTNRDRCANPAGGLFSTARDVCRFCQMVMNGGELDGRRYLSPQSVGLMTTTTTGTLLNGGESERGYGLGWNTTQYYDETHILSVKPYMHSGAFRTDMCIDPEHNLLMVTMIQRENCYDEHIFHDPLWDAALKSYGSAEA